jgi:exonuclease VII large subunit
MTRLRIAMLAAAVLIGLAGCKRTEPPGGSGATQTPPTSAPATAPAATESADKLDRLREQMEQEAARTADSAKKLALSVAEQIRARYEDRVRRALDGVDEHIAELERELAEAGEAARPALEHQLAKWKERAQGMREKLEKLRGASDEVWLGLKKDLDAAIDEVRQALPGAPSPSPATEPASVPTTRPGA